MLEPDPGFSGQSGLGSAVLPLTNPLASLEAESKDWVERPLFLVEPQVTSIYVLLGIVSTAIVRWRCCARGQTAKISASSSAT